MQKARPSKKKAYYKNLKPDRNSSSKQYVDWRQVGKKSSGRGENSPTELDNESNTEQDILKLEKKFSKRNLQQPNTSRLGDLDEIWQETNVGQDFELLVNAPLSTSSFAFKSEKNWALDASKYDEYFSIDVKNLADIVSCIPFNQLLELDDKYFTTDQLTYINDTAEQARKAYNQKLKSMRNENQEADSTASRPSESEEDSRSDANQSPQSTRLTDVENPDSKTIEEDLDFLLSLKEPLRAQPAVNVASSTKSGPNELKAKNIPAATKSIDLEKWLDLVLDD